jgi:hypothetical protein
MWTRRTPPNGQISRQTTNDVRLSYSSFLIPVSTVLLAFLWQLSLVHLVFGGNWTALFCAGDQFSRPPEIAEYEYVFKNSAGYDGQFYQLIAHDPLLTRHYDRFIDAPRLRCRRILIPGLAYVLGAGQDVWIDWAYLVVCWLAIGIGTFCLAELAAADGRSRFWGLLFLVTPATLIAIERMTVDIGITALCLAALLAARRQSWRLLWITLAAASLCKETGLIAIFAAVIWLMRQQKNRLALAIAASVLPALAWYAYVHSHTSGDFGTSDFAFLTAFFASLTPLQPGVIRLLIRISTLGAVFGMLWIAARSIILAIQNRFHDLPHLLCFFFALFVFVFENSASWVELNAFPRIYSPLLAASLAAGFQRGFTHTLISFAVVACPVVMQAGVHLIGPLLRPLLTH